MTFLIGRDHPAAALRSAVERTVASHGGLALVTGEAGIGKSTLVTDVAARFRGELTVAFATSWESEAVPDHWLWVQVLRSLRAQLGDEAWQSLHPAPPVDALLGKGDGSAPAPFELYDAVTQLLIAASQRGPLLVVLDDLHFADPGSLELLKFASQHTWFERILFVATYRDSEIDPGHRLRARMLPLVAKATMISLEGLDEEGVAALCRTTVGDAPDAATVAEITRRTGGNPFFVEQTAQLWASGQRVDATTAGMRDALQRRIEHLPEPLVRMLTLASVGGREFHAGVMAQASGLDLHRIESALDAACQTRLVRRETDRYVFVHDLVRETLYNTMSSEEAAHHHGCVVRALVADESLQKLMLTTEIAHHAWLAGDDLDPAIAVEFLERAATESRGCLSAPGAEKYFRRALERCTPEMARRRVLLRLELAATVKWLQREEESWKHYDQAVYEARDSGDPMLLARAAIELPQNERPDALCRLKADAYEALTGKRPDPGLDYDGLTRQLNYEFLMAARKIGDDDEVAFGLWATHSVDWGPGTAAARQVIVEELDEITRRTGDIDMRLYAASLRWVAMLEQGDPAFRSQVDFFCALAESSDSDRWHSGAEIDHAVVDIVQGRWDAAAQRIDKAYAAAGEDLMNDHMMRHLRWELAFARGEAPEPIRDSGWTAFGMWHFDLLAALSAVRRGDLEEAHRAKSRFEDEAEPHDPWVSLRLRFEVELAAAEGDAEAIAALRRRLEPHEGEWLVALWGTSIHGPISHWLGVLAAASGDHDRAAAHFAAAIEQAERLDAPPWAEAARTALAGTAAPAPERRTAAAPGAVFRREGATWTLRYEGRGVHLPHTKGLADLHRLLRQPGVEVPAVELLAAPLHDHEGGEAVTADARLGGDDLLDAEARARYRDHLERLDEQIDTAAALGDDARAARLDAERQALIEQLKAATGLGGRSRRLGDNAERARKSVTNRIRNTLKKIEAVHPALAAHLHAAVATGSACVYRPETEPPRWEL